jgi:hypothetical protein
MDYMAPDIALVLTQYKRNHLQEQLEAIKLQTLQPKYIIIFQNENHVDITPLKKDYNFIHIHSDYNTKYFGRFAALFTFPVDVCIVMDDDVIPGPKCIETYVGECLAKNAIVGGNGRYAFMNPNKSSFAALHDVGIRNTSLKVDFVGHVWVFRKNWLHYMFSIKPFTYDTGEDMHLCFSSKLLGNIESYVCVQKTQEELSDTKYNMYAVDDFSSFKTTPSELRKGVEEYFVSKGLTFMESQ